MGPLETRMNNDHQRIICGVLGTAASLTLESVAVVASILAGLATAAFMSLSALEKLRNMLKK